MVKTSSTNVGNGGQLTGGNRKQGATLTTYVDQELRTNRYVKSCERIHGKLIHLEHGRYAG